MNQHKDCKYFDNGVCTAMESEVNPEEEACLNFEHKEVM